MRRLREEQRRDEKGLLQEQYWYELSQPINEDGDYCEQYELMLDIRSKLKEYSKYHTDRQTPTLDLTANSDETLLQYKQMTALENPTKHDLRRLRDWLVRSEGGDNFLQGIEREILHADDRLDPDQERASDLVTLSREAVEHDFFSRWLSDEVLDKFHSLIGRHIKVLSPPTYCSKQS